MILMMFLLFYISPALLCDPPYYNMNSFIGSVDVGASSASGVPRRGNPSMSAAEPEIIVKGPELTGWRSPHRQAAVVAGFAYAVLILIMWGAFNPHSGLPYETAFPYTSETSSAWRGFFYYADSSRIHTSTFYHLSYLLSEALGIKGSYLPFQVIYALLWWARGFLVFVLVRKFLPACLSVCYAAGALVVVHSSDGALQWVGQMNQFGFIFWMLLAFFFLTLAFDAANRYLAALFTLVACFLEYMSLWSYESQILLLLLFPLLLLARRRQWRKLVAMAAAWYAVSSVYIGLAVIRYARSAGQTYQASVMRKSGSVGTVLDDWTFNIAASLKFWEWQRGPWKASESQAWLLSLIAAAVFVVAGVAVVRLGRETARRNAFGESVRTWWTLLAAGFILLALSFPVYLLLDSARGLWRTQFLSGIGAGLVLTALLGLASRVFARPAARVAVFLALASVITLFGSVSAIQKGALHRWYWERHRTAVTEILQVAPSVKPNTIIVLTNVSKDNDPFGHNMWMDLALRLAYPGIPVAGIYFYADGTPGPGNNLKAKGDSWKWDGKGFPPNVHATALADTVVVDFEPSGRGRLESALPQFVCRAQCETKLYDPAAVITGPPSPVAIRRYRLNGALD
jgi:hypothetical protein